MLFRVCWNSAGLSQCASLTICDSENAKAIANVPKANITSDLFLAARRLQKGIDSDNRTAQTIELIESQRQGNCVSCRGRMTVQMGRDKGVAMKSVCSNSSPNAVVPLLIEFFF